MALVESGLCLLQQSAVGVAVEIVHPYKILFERAGQYMLVRREHIHI